MQRWCMCANVVNAATTALLHFTLRVIRRGVRYLFVRMSPELKRRIAIAAAYDETSFGRYCRRALEKWMGVYGKNGGDISAVEGEIGSYVSMRVPVSENGGRDVRVIAARLGISANRLAIRVFEHTVPFEVEHMAREMNSEAQAQPSVSVAHKEN